MVLAETDNLYHNLESVGYWTNESDYLKNLTLKNKKVLIKVVPTEIGQLGETLIMKLSTFEGNILEPINNFPGLEIVRGDSKLHPHETDGELLIEFTYFKIDHMEDKPRRIRPTAIMFGIHGNTDKESLEKGGHRAMGESADYYLEGLDTQYDPKIDKVGGMRRFPFWRIGVWGDPTKLTKIYLPQAPGK